MAKVFLKEYYNVERENEDMDMLNIFGMIGLKEDKGKIQT